MPAFVELGELGLMWWRWAWKTPQAAAWPPGSEGFVARRAMLEDLGDTTPSMLRERREMDDRLGLTPKAMLALRWTIGEPEATAELAEVVIPDRWRDRATAGG